MSGRISQLDAAITQIGPMQQRISQVQRPLPFQLLHQRQLQPLIAGTPHVLLLVAGRAAAGRGIHRHGLDLVAHPAVEDGCLPLGALPECPLHAQLQMMSQLGLQVGIGQRPPQPCRVAILDGGKARALRHQHIGLVTRCAQDLAKADQPVRGIRLAGRPLVDLLRIPLVMAQLQRQPLPVIQCNVIGRHQRSRHVPIASSLVVMPIHLVVCRQAQRMRGKRMVFPRRAQAKAHVLVAAGRVMRGVTGVAIHVQPVLVRVVVETRLQHIACIQPGGCQHIHTVLVPVRPAPVARRIARRGSARIDRVALLASLAHIAHGVLVRRIGHQPQLERQAPVLAVGIRPIFASIGGLTLEILEPLGQPEMIGLQQRGTHLVIPEVLLASQVQRRLASSSSGQPQAHIAFEGLRRPARHQVDRTTQRVGAVQQRSTCLGHTHLCQIEGREAVEVRIAVIRHIQRDAVHVHRHLSGIEAAHVQHRLVAAVHRQAHPRQMAYRVRHRIDPGSCQQASAQLQHIRLHRCTCPHLDSAQLEYARLLARSRGRLLGRCGRNGQSPEHQHHEPAAVQAGQGM